MLESTLGRVSAGEDLSMEEMAAAIEAVIQGKCSDGEIALLLTALRAKGETVAEVAGAASVLRRHMQPIHSDRGDLLDTCGTGGDASQTFNISTAAAIVAAAAGVPVAKHGNRGITSRSGSANVLATLGVNIDASVAQVEACLAELGICFCYAPLLHPSMKRVAEVRQKLGVPTIFNILGPLANPAGAPFQLVGVGRRELRPLLAEALALLGAKRALVVCGEDGLDEVTLADRTHVSEVVDGKIREFTWSPTDFGIHKASLAHVRVADPEESAAMIRGVLAGEQGPPRDIVLLNAAAALLAAGADEAPIEAARRAAKAIDSGVARALLGELAQRSHRN